jgi:serine/threonine-protein kinase
LSDRYRIERELGQGGMATVFLAQDLRHDRPVAVKVLRPELAAVIGAARFLAEIRTTANLQHPHILPLHDSGEVAGTVFYVMPYVEGESLRDRLERETQLPIDDAVAIAGEVADALEYAHQHGVIHRDIKPENILLHGGHALVADFGIALAASSTAGTRMTETGMSLGTPAYMSPEQAMGERALDARTDVYALGCVLYEMLVGEAPFSGPTAQAIVAKVMTERARAPSAGRDTVPPWLDRVVQTALEKLPADRYSSAARMREALERRTTGETPAAAHQAGNVRRAVVVAPWLVAAAAIAAAGWFATKAGPSSTATFASLLPPPGRQFATQNSFGALSPDGRRFAFVTMSASGDRQLWLRDLGAARADSLEGTAGARAPFWSPDGKSLGYFAQSKLWRLDLDGTPPKLLCDVPRPKSAAWGLGGQIVVVSARNEVRLGRTDGGPCPIRSGDSLPGAYAWTVSFLPDGKRFLLAADGERTAQLGRVDRAGLSPVLPGVHGLAVAASSALVYLSGSRLLIQAFDPGRVALTGEPVVLTNTLRTDAGFGSFAASARAVIFLRSGAAEPQDISTIESKAKDIDVGGTDLWTMQNSWSGRQAAFAGNGLWIHDRGRSTLRAVLPKSQIALFPAWAPGDTAIAVSTTDCQFIVLNLTRGTRDERYNQAGDCSWASDWTADGRYLVLTKRWRSRGSGRAEIWTLNLATRVSEQEFATEASVSAGSVSPDQRWLAYVSDETGGGQVFVRPFKRPGPSERVSPAGGWTPRWSRDGRSLYYLTPRGQIIRVAVLQVDPLRLGQPEVQAVVGDRDLLFASNDYEGNLIVTPFDILPTPGRFTTLLGKGTGSQAELVLDWQQLLAMRR